MQIFSNLFDEIKKIVYFCGEVAKSFLSHLTVLGGGPVMSNYSFKFDPDKAIQAVAFLLKQSDEATYDYYRLLKILYIADTESLKESGYPITGDDPCAMEDGPTLSAIYDEVKESKDDKWHEYIEYKEPYYAKLKRNPGKGKLSPFEIDKLKKTWEKYGDKSYSELKDLTHEFYEQKKNQPPKDSSRPISLSDILKAPRMDLAEYKEEIKQNARDTHELADA